MMGPIKATIVYAALGLISLVFLTNFRLSDWIRALIPEKFLAEEPSPQEEAGAGTARP